MSTAAAVVVVFAYNRPEHLAECLAALSACDRANESSVLVFSDAARNAKDEAGVARVRRLLSDEKWRFRFLRFDVVEARVNQGLAKAIVTGVTQILEANDSVIVVEDDLIVARDFLSFMNDCLDYYRDDNAIGAITGYCPLPDMPAGYEHDVMLVPRICSHGWATWASRWREVDWEPAAAMKMWRDPVLRRRFNCAGSDQLYRLRRQLAGRIRTWAILFQVWLISSGRVAVYPVTNRVKNIGFDDSGVHTRSKDRHFQSDVAQAAIPYHLSRPDISLDVVTAFHRVYSGSMLGRIKRALINSLPPAVACESISIS